MNHGDNGRRFGRVGLAAVSTALILGPYLLRLSLLRTRTFDPDEFQHLHAAWSVHEGLLPFRDFFEHHMPGIQYLLASLMGPFHAATSVEDAIRVMFLARTLMWAFAGCSLVLTMMFGARYGGPPVGWLSGALLSLSLVFVGRTLEIRPDTPALACWLASSLALLRALDDRDARDQRRIWFAVGGLWLGCGLVFNQKLLLAGPGLVASGMWYLVDPTRVSRPPGTRIVDLASVCAGCAVPLLLLTAYFWAQGAATDFVRGAFINNLGWPREVSAVSTLRWMLLRDPIFSALGVAGVVQATVLVAREPWSSPAGPVLLFPTASFFAGLAIIPAPYPQYMLLVLPAGAVFGAAAIWRAVTELPAHRSLTRENAVRWLAVVLSFVAVAVLGLVVARPFFLHPAAYPVFGVTALTIAFVLARRTWAEWAAVVLVLACSVYSVQQLRWMQGLSNAEALKQMRYVEQVAQPTETVLDGFTGVAWFRRSASFYPFLHPGVRARLGPPEVASLVALFDSCVKRPSLVILDENLLALSPAMAPAVSRYYEPSPLPPIWLIKPAWRGCQGQ